MKKLLIFLLVLFTLVSGVSALDIEVNVSSGNFYLFDAYGDRINLSDARVEDGIILLTGDEWLDIDCTYGKISLAPESILNVLSLDPAHPILYLVAGEASFFPSQDFYLEVYTPVSLVSTDRQGEFRIVTTAEEEKIYNMNNGDLRVLDGLTGVIEEIPDLTFVDHIEGTIGDMDSNDYRSASRFTAETQPIHFFTDLGLPTLREEGPTELDAALMDNDKIRIEPVIPRIPGLPVIEVGESDIYDPDYIPVPEAPEVSVRESDIIEPAPAPVIEDVKQELVEVEEAEIEEPEVLPAPEITEVSSEIIDTPEVPEVTANPVLEGPSVPTVPELSKKEQYLVPTAPEFGETYSELYMAGFPTAPKLTVRIHTPEAPELFVKSTMIKRGYVPEAPEFISSKSFPSFFIPEKPQGMRVKTQEYKEPVLPPIVKVYEDKPGFSSWDAETYRPASKKGASSQKKTSPTLTSSSK